MQASYLQSKLRVVSCSLTPAAASTLVYAFVVSRLDYFCAIYEGLQAFRLICLDRVLRMAANLCLARSLGIYGGYASLASPPAANCLPRIFVGSALYRGSSTYLREPSCSHCSIQRHISPRSSSQAEILVPRTRTDSAGYSLWLVWRSWSSSYVAQQ